jgi:hypothetical protein
MDTETTTITWELAFNKRPQREVKEGSVRDKKSYLILHSQWCDVTIIKVCAQADN